LKRRYGVDFGDGSEGVLEAVQMYLPEGHPTREAMARVGTQASVAFAPYDWALNATE
jgi:hypothetical protein